MFIEEVKMFDKIKDKQSFITDYFESVLKKDKDCLSHAYMFTGSNTSHQYYTALQVAKALNCNNLKDINNCNCLSCNWIEQNKHPAIITISPMDFTYDKEGMKSKPSNVIKVDQARYLKKVLSKTSPYHRVIIFTGALETKEASIIRNNLYNPPSCEEDEEKINWIPAPLSYKIFHDETANTLLKTIEEPPANVTFFFLSSNREDMLETIVSRCQVLQFSYHKEGNKDLSLLSSLFVHFPPKNIAEALYLSESFMAMAKENAITPQELLDYLQKYIFESIKSNPEDYYKFKKLVKHIKNIEKGRNDIESYVNPQAVVDSIFLDFIN